MQDAVQAAIVAGGGGGYRRLRPHSYHQQALKCPRCESLNTKFCYYNNYNLSQPRHYCKSCRRYWTKGGVLRNVPVGGGCRKAKRSSSAKSRKEVTDTVPIQRPEGTTKTNTTDLASSTETSTLQHEEGDTTMLYSARDEAGLLVSTHQDEETAQHGLNVFTACMTTTSSEDLIGFGSSHDHMNPKVSSSSSCGDVVDYGDTTWMFDLTAVIDPSYWKWNDQSSPVNDLP